MKSSERDNSERNILKGIAINPHRFALDDLDPQKMRICSGSISIKQERGLLFDRELCFRNILKENLFCDAQLLKKNVFFLPLCKVLVRII